MTELEEEQDHEFEKSKSQVKRELQALKELGRALIALPVKDINKLDLPEDIAEAVIKAKELPHGALKRQTGFIGGLIARYDFEEIQKQFEKLKQAHHGEVKQFHQLEQWRDELIAGNPDVMTVLHNQFDSFDGQYARQLIRNATKEASQNKAPKSARLLFKYLQQCQAEQESA